MVVGRSAIHFRRSKAVVQCIGDDAAKAPAMGDGQANRRSGGAVRGEPNQRDFESRVQVKPVMFGLIGCGRSSRLESRNGWCVMCSVHTIRGRVFMTVRRATQNDLAAIVNLINGVFGVDRDLEWFTHFHHNNPSGESVLWLAQNDEGEAVSYRSIVRFRAYYMDHMIEGGQFADACTRSDYRGRGIYSKVNTRAMEDFFGSGGDMIYAFPGPHNYRILTDKFSFQSIADFRQGFCPLDAYPAVSVPANLAKRTHEIMFRKSPGADPGVTVVPAHEGLAALVFPRSDGGKLSIDRSQEFLKWRTSVPGRRYWIAAMDQHNYAILGEAVRHGLRVCTVTDMRYANRFAKSRLLSGIRTWADARDYEGVYSWLSRDWLTYVRAGFVPVANQTHLLVRFSEEFPLRHRLSRGEEWDLRLLDTDAY